MKSPPVAKARSIVPALAALLLTLFLAVQSPASGSGSGGRSDSTGTPSNGLNVSFSVHNQTGSDITVARPGTWLEIVAEVACERAMTGVRLTCKVGGSTLGREEGPFAVGPSMPARQNWTWVPSAEGDPFISIEASGPEAHASASMMFAVITHDLEVGPCYMGWNGSDSPDFWIGLDELVIAPEIDNAGDLPVNTTTSFWLDNVTLLLEQSLEVPAGRSANVTLKTNLSGLNLSEGWHDVSARVSPGLGGCGIGFTGRIPAPDALLTEFFVPEGLRAGAEVEVSATVVNAGPQGANGLWVRFYDGSATLNGIVPFDLEANSSRVVNASITLPGPPNSDHVFRARLYHQEMNLSRSVGTGTIGIKSFYARPDLLKGNGTRDLATTTLYLTLFNRGNDTGIVNLTIRGGEVLLGARRGIAVPASSEENITVECGLTGAGGHNVSVILDGPDADAMRSTAHTYVRISSSSRTSGCLVMLFLPPLLLPAVLFRIQGSRRVPARKD